MPETSQTPDERRAYLLDISMFIFDFLSPIKIQKHLEMGDRILEVPGALVTMIWSAHTGSPLLYNFIYAHILGMKKRGVFEKIKHESVHKWAEADAEILKILCSSVHDNLLNYYTPLIEGAMKGGNSVVPLIKRYEPASDLSAETDLAYLRKTYKEELGLGPHPLYDLYFLQVRHAQDTGIAASPPLKRLFIFIGQQTADTLSTWVRPTDPISQNLPARERYLRHMAWFMQEFLRDEIRDQALEGLLGISASYILTGVSGINILTGVSVSSYLARMVYQSTLASPALKADDKYMILGIASTLIMLCLCSVMIWPTARQYLPLASVQASQALPTPTQAPAQALLLASDPNQPALNPPAEMLMVTATPPPAPVNVVLPSQYSDAGYCTYVVQPGDTLSGIAARFQLSEADLKAGDKTLAWGAFTVNQKIHINASCCRPQGINGFSYSVQSGETLFSIARRYSTSVERLASINSLYDASYIQAGQMLCIPY